MTDIICLWIGRGFVAVSTLWLATELTIKAIAYALSNMEHAHDVYLALKIVWKNNNNRISAERDNK